MSPGICIAFLFAMILKVQEFWYKLPTTQMIGNSSWSRSYLEGRNIHKVQVCSSHKFTLSCFSKKQDLLFGKNVTTVRWSSHISSHMRTAHSAFFGKTFRTHSKDVSTDRHVRWSNEVSTLQVRSSSFVCGQSQKANYDRKLRLQSRNISKIRISMTVES